MAAAADIGIVGIGVMGGPLTLNMLDKGFTVAIYDVSAEVRDRFAQEHMPAYGGDKLLVGSSYEEFAGLLKVPRKVIILVPAGQPTESVIENLMRTLEDNDVIVDTGNSHFKDQSRRAEAVEAAGKRFLGMGISGGAEGARKGPAFFPGGTLSIWEDIRPIVEAAAAKASDGQPCVTMCGRGGAGSCVKMYHNAGEYAVLQIWAEVCATLYGLGCSGEEVKSILSQWQSRGDLCSYMLDITLEVVAQPDDVVVDGGLLVERVADMIGSKGTGLWSVTVALDCGEPVPSLAAAVLARQMSMARPSRVEIAGRLQSTVEAVAGACTSANERAAVIEDLYWATYLSIVASYAQMFQAVRTVDKHFDLQITSNLPRIIGTFRAGCILQGALLEPMTAAFEKDPSIPNLLCAFQDKLAEGMPGFRRTCARLAMGGEPAGVMQASLTYVTTMARPVLNAAQVVSLQRDVFGRHGFKRMQAGEVTQESYNAKWKEMIP